MGLKRRNPARNRLFTAPAMLAVLSAPVANQQAAKPAVPAAPEALAPALVPGVSQEERHRMIAVAAYGRAERSGFAGDPLVNWLDAEREIDALLGRKAS